MNGTSMRARRAMAMGLVLGLGVAGEAARAEIWVFTNECGGGLWSAICPLEEGGCINNWNQPCPGAPWQGDTAYLPSGVGAVTIINGGAGVVDAEVPISLYGTLSVTIGATFEGPVTWYDGQLNGGSTDGEFHFYDRLDIYAPATKYISNGSVVRNFGEATVEGVVVFDRVFGSGLNPEFHNEVFLDVAPARLSLLGDTTFVGQQGAGDFYNKGIIEVYGECDTTATFAMPFENSGEVIVHRGTLALTRGSSGGSFYVSDDCAAIEITGSGIFSFEDGATITGPGWTYLVDSADYPVSGTVTAQHLALTAGRLGGDGHLVIGDPLGDSSASLSWTGGNIGDNDPATTLTTTITPGASLLISGDLIKDLRNPTVMENEGETVWTGTGYVAGRGSFNNVSGAAFRAQNDALWQLYGPFNNAGAFIKENSAGETLFRGPGQFNHSGVFEVQSGSLKFAGAQLTSTAPFHVETGSTLEFTYYAVGNINWPGHYTLDAGTSFTGDGLLRVVHTTVTVPEGVTVPVVNLELSDNSAIVDGEGELSVSGSLAWTGGMMRDAGVTTIESGATAEISGSAAKNIYSGRVLNNAGEIVWSDSGVLRLSNGTINNQAGGVFDVRNDVLVDYVSGVSSFNNAGTFVKSAGTGTTKFDWDLPFTNTGTVEVQSGTLEFGGGDGGYAQTAGVTRLAGGNLTAYYLNPIDIQGGRLEGSGTIAGPLVNGGEVSPGESIGALAVTYTFVQLPGGSLDIELGGTAPGEFDELNIGSGATLDGVLNISLIDGYVPQVGDAFEVMTFASRDGEFATINGLTQGNAELSATYTATGVIIEVVNIEEVPGDSDGDGDVDLDDYGAFVDCVTGVGGGVPQECVAFDFDEDEDIDLADWAQFQVLFTGP